MIYDKDFDCYAIDIGGDFVEANTYLKQLDETLHEQYVHSIDVCNIANQIAIKIKMSDEDRKNLLISALYHDIGKLWIETDIINKKGKLSNEEYLIVKNHSLFSYMIMRKCGYSEKVTIPILYHHENEDGTGYPYGFTSDKIPLSAAIIHIADVWSALIMPRCYKPAFTPAEAKRLMESERRKYRSEILDILLYDIM